MKGNGKIWIFYDSLTQKQTKPLSTLNAQMTLLSMKVKDPDRIFIWTPGWTKWVPLQQFLESDQTYFVVAPAPKPKTDEPPAFDEKTVRAEAPLEDTVTHVLHPEFAQDTESSEYTEILPDHRPPPSQKKDYGYYHEDFRADQIDPEARFKVDMNLPGKRPNASDNPANRRLNPRHQFKIEVILINKNGRTFRTSSLNISLGGTLLQDELPKEFINARFDLILVNKFEKDPSKGRLHFQGRVVGDYTDPRRLMFLDTDEHTLKRLESMLRSYLDQQKKIQKKKAG
ncbi:MAG TPA: PilZ domain-containing protein [Pseudobdellovibrionaceae bacterium]|nr:PilZ domain-containing protein [Pseudobdellovibrionaceae bacterium]